MSDEQPGPPTEAERERVSMEFLRVSQLRFLEGYRARMARLHPMRKNPKGDTLNQREDRWSYAEPAGEECPQGLPAHEQERWVAGFLHADSIAAERGTAAMERADPGRPPPRLKRAVVAVQEDALLAVAPPVSRQEARAFWERHRGKHGVYVDPGDSQ